MHPGIASKIFSKIAIKGPDFVGNSLGPIGKKLVSLFENLGNHPETDAFFFEEGDLALCDLMDLADYADKFGMSFFAQHLPFVAERQASERLKNARNPCQNGCSARFLRKPIRDEARKTRRVQKVQSKTFVLSAKMLWPSIPCDFSLFLRGRCAPKNTEALEAAARFDSMGCRNLAAAAHDVHERFRSPICFAGYKRLKILDACMILAKSGGFLPDGEDLVRDSLALRPLVVPLHEVAILPSRVQESIDDAEHSRALFFESAFDNYFVLVPFAEQRSEFSPPESCDWSSVLHSSSNSAVFGERDGECYFVCEWNRVNYNNL